MNDDHDEWTLLNAMCDAGLSIDAHGGFRAGRPVLGYRHGDVFVEVRETSYVVLGDEGGELKVASTAKEAADFVKERKGQ